MKTVKLAGMTGLALLLAACGGSGEEPAASDEIAAPAAEAPAATETAAADGTGSPVEAEAAAKGAGAEKAVPASPTPAAAVTAAAPAPIAAAAEPPKAFAICKTCHKAEPGKHGIGPSLAGVFRARAGKADGFQYSTAMQDSGLTWDEATLHAYLENPRKVVPGGKMSYAGQKDQAKRQEIIDYLKSI